MRFVWMLLLIDLIEITKGKHLNFPLVKELFLLNGKNATNIYVLQKTVTELKKNPY